MDSSGDEAERRRRARSDAARKRGARRWLNRGSRPPPKFGRRELDEFDRELARRRHASSDSWSAESSSAGASSSRLIPVKRDPEEELSPRAVEPDAPPRRGVIGPEDYLPPGQEELLKRVVLERSAREQEEMEERLFLKTGVAASQAQASKEADLRLMKPEQAKFYIDLDSSDSSDSD